MNNYTEKISRKIRMLFNSRLVNTPIYKYLFVSYWHYMINKRRSRIKKRDLLYIAIGMNNGAGMAHQLENWYRGYELSMDLDVGYANSHIWINGKHAEEDDRILVGRLAGTEVYTNSFEWEKLLGISEISHTIEVLRGEQYRVHRVPFYDFSSEDEISEFKQLIESYKGEKVVLYLQDDQVSYVGDVNLRSKILREIFWNAKVRELDSIEFKEGEINISAHIRRGDVNKSDYPDRFLDDNYYINAINLARTECGTDQKINIFIFSEGETTEFETYCRQFCGVKLCVNWSSKKSFLHMIYSDVLIVGNSGFSVHAAEISNAKRYAYVNSFVKYCDCLEWIMLDENGYRV